MCYFLCYFYSVKPTAIPSNKNQTQISPPSQGAHNYQKVYDGRKRRVRGLWKRCDTFYAQLSLGRPFGFTDEDLAKQILTDAKAKQYSISEFIQSLVLSQTFEKK